MVALVPSHPPSAARAEALAVLGQGLLLCWQFERSRVTCEQALAMARAVGDPRIEVRALDVLGGDLAYLGRAEAGLSALRQARDLAEAMQSPHDVFVAYVSLTDALMMLGRPGESVEVGRRGLEVVRRYGGDATVLIANIIEALIASGGWDDADRLSAAAVRSITANYPYMLLMNRAELELGRGDFASAKAHLEAALPSLREDRGQGIYDLYLAELALWERRWIDADAHVEAALTGASSPHADQLRVWFSAKGLRAVAELAALARARRDADAAIAWLAKADRLVTIARSAAATASSITPNAGGWLALAEAEYDRAHGRGAPGHLVRRSQHLGTPRTPGVGGLLPLARVPRRSLPWTHPARPLPSRCGRHTPLRPGSAPNHSGESSNCSPNVHGSTSPVPSQHRPTTRRAGRTGSASLLERSTSSVSSLAATRTPTSPQPCSSASRPQASTCPTSCASSTCRIDAKPPPLPTASRPRHRTLRSDQPTRPDKRKR